MSGLMAKGSPPIRSGGCFAYTRADLPVLPCKARGRIGPNRGTDRTMRERDEVPAICPRRSAPQSLPARGRFGLRFETMSRRAVASRLMADGPPCRVEWHAGRYSRPRAAVRIHADDRAIGRPCQSTINRMFSMSPRVPFCAACRDVARTGELSLRLSPALVKID